MKKVEISIVNVNVSYKRVISDTLLFLKIITSKTITEPNKHILGCPTGSFSVSVIRDHQLKAFHSFLPLFGRLSFKGLG